MHVILFAIILAFAMYILVVKKPITDDSGGTTARKSLNKPISFISNGLVFQRDSSGEISQLHSPFIEEAKLRLERSAAKHAWKEGTSFSVKAGGGVRNFGAHSKPFQATSAAYDASGDLVYFLKDDSVGGLFRLEKDTGRELRLALNQNFFLTDITISPDGEKIAASSVQPNFTSNIALLDSEGGDYREVTGGDTLDSSPAWVPEQTNSLLFQSVGIARNEEGFILAQGNASIQMLDMESGEVKPVLEDKNTDYLCPRVAPFGDLLFIRRPFELPGYGLADSFLDSLFFPFRLMRALFHYLNFFSLMYSRKPLTSADNPGVQADVKDILLQGKRIDAENSMRKARPVQGVPSLVPDSWELVARTRTGQERVLARNVATFDIFEDGTIIYSNGHGAFVIDNDGSSGVVFSGELIESVVAS